MKEKADELALLVEILKKRNAVWLLSKYSSEWILNIWRKPMNLVRLHLAELQNIFKPDYNLPKIPPHVKDPVDWFLWLSAQTSPGYIALFKAWCKSLGVENLTEIPNC
jgi:hypothetical protein